MGKRFSTQQVTKLHLTEHELNSLAIEVERIRADVMKDIGEKDARYIRRVVKAVRFTEILGRGLLFFGFFPPTWLLGTALLSLSKVLENMELGHNVIHGQYDWMKDPSLNGKTYEWDIAGTAANWRKTHNYRHHTYTNVKDLDDDIGYGVIRLFPEQKWSAKNLFQPIYSVVFAILFQWGIAIQELRLGKVFRGGVPWSELKPNLIAVLRKVRFQMLKDYVFFPLLAFYNFVPVFVGNFVANLIRNVWTFTIIFCGHFTKEAHLFHRNILKNESKGHWYARQIMGSANLTGGSVMHILTGNLSHQIEHHLFPDIPARRYAEISGRVRELCAKYKIKYNSGSLVSQFSQVIYRICRYSLPA